MPTDELTVPLPDEAATLALGAALATALAERPDVALLLSGPLGAGKTTLVRGLTAALPGAENARVSSPSFTLVNRYPTTPAIAHMDLYRLEDGHVAEEVEDALDEPHVLAVVEWAERLPAWALPEHRLHVRLAVAGAGRSASLTAEGNAALDLLRGLAKHLPSRPEVA